MTGAASATVLPEDFQRYWSSALDVPPFIPLAQLDNQGEWYPTFNAALLAAQQHASLWIESLGPQVFSELPQAIIDYGNPENSYTETAWFGLGPPLVIGIGIFLTGVVLMIIWYFRDRRFWDERPSTAEQPIVRIDVTTGRGEGPRA